MPLDALAVVANMLKRGVSSLFLEDLDGRELTPDGLTADTSTGN
jgi:hypothetical protein